MAEVGHMSVDIRAVLAALEQLGQAVADDALDSAAMAGGLVVEGAGKMGIIRYDFIDTGATLNSTAAREAGAGEVEVGPATEYAIYGEMGWGGQSEKPFMREALNARGSIEQAVAAELRAAIERAVKR